MRRLLAMMMALLLVIPMGTTVFAAETEGKPTADYRSEEKTADILIEKLYQIHGSDNAELYPVETLTFEADPDDSNPDTTNLTIAPLAVTGNTNQALTITLPVYSKVGTYKYTISETTDKEMQGVTYSEDAIAMTVLVTYNYAEEKLDTQIVLSSTTAGDQSSDANEDGKVDTFINQYEVGQLTLEKTVTGNLGAKDVYFDIEVTFTSGKEVASAIPVTGGSYEGNPSVIVVEDWEEAGGSWTCTKVFKLKDSDMLTFADLPKGVSYAVKEAAKHGVGEDGFDVNSATDTDYTVTYTGETGTIATGETAAACVKNEKSTSVDTGVLLDSAPYVLMMTAGAAGMIILLGKKRYEI